MQACVAGQWASVCLQTVRGAREVHLATAIIPIRKNGRPWKQDCPAAAARNALRATRHCGRAFRKRWTEYHAPSRIKV